MIADRFNNFFNFEEEISADVIVTVAIKSML